MASRRKSRVLTFVLGGGLVAIITCSLAFAQDTRLDLKRPFSEQLAAKSAEVPTRPSTALEGPVDPDVYILGPGDQIEFRVWGKIEVRQVIPVSPDGNLSIPSVGDIAVVGKTVTTVDSLIKVKAGKIYPQENISLHLYQLRRMKASISGAVENPGVYELSATDRLSALIEAAAGFAEDKLDTKEEATSETQQSRKANPETAEEETRDLELFPPAFPSQRHIKVTGSNGEMRMVDFQVYTKTGNLDYNPYIRDGDQVHVPLMDYQVGLLHIFGAVKSPGDYEFVQGDRLIDLITLAGGFQADALISDIEIIRFNDQGENERKISVNLLENYGQGSGPPLKPDDRIFIRRIPDYRNKYQVTVKGEVKYPGIYSIDQDRSTLGDIIAACGGFTERANLNSATVIRRSVAETEDPEYERLKRMTVAEMDEMEYEYFKTRSREEAPAVVVDFKKLFSDGEKDMDVNLRNKDEIEIPTISPTVNVTGQVNRAGLIRWVPGKNVDYYIEKAGGFSWNARKGKMRLIKSQTGKWLKPRKSSLIEIGDTIFVPEKQEIKYWDFWKDLLMVFSQIATIVIVARTV